MLIRFSRPRFSWSPCLNKHISSISAKSTRRPVSSSTPFPKESTSRDKSETTSSSSNHPSSSSSSSPSTTRSNPRSSHLRRPRSNFPIEPALSLQHFLLRLRSLSLYRSILRILAHQSDPTTRDEMRMYARSEIEARKGETDLTRIRYLIGVGKAEVERLRSQVNVGHHGQK